MKNYHFTSRIAFTLFKWVALDITFWPKCNEVLKFSIDYKKNCSLPGIYFSLSLFRFFNLWFSIYDQRIWDDKIKKLALAPIKIPRPFSANQIKDADGLLRDLIHLSPRFDQIFHKYDHLTDEAWAYKKDFNCVSNEMESYLRRVITPKR